MVAALLANPKARKAAIIGGAVLTIGVGLFIFQRRLKNAQEEVNRSEALKQFGVNTKEGKAIGYATNLYQATKGWGTKEKLIFNTISQAKADDISFVDLASAFNKLYAKDLLKVMQKELNSKEFVKLQAVI